MRMSHRPCILRIKLSKCVSYKIVSFQKMQCHQNSIWIRIVENANLCNNVCFKSKIYVNNKTTIKSCSIKKGLTKWLC